MKVKNILTISLLASSMLIAACGPTGPGSTSDGPSYIEADYTVAAEALGTYDVKMWGSETEGIPALFAQQVDAFEALNPGLTINLTYEEVSEANASADVLQDVDAAADIYCFAQDQFADLVMGNALSRLGDSFAQTVKANNDAGSVGAVTSGDYLYGYPMTSDNGYFMYYDKRVVSEDIVGNMEAIVEAVEDAGKTFAMETNTSAWYIASFFFGANCVSSWKTDSEGTFIEAVDDWNSAKGMVAMRGMQHLVKSSAYVSSSNAAESFAAATPAAVVVSGTWDYNNAVAALGENLGVAELPSYTVDGTSYHLGSFSGNKLVGVKPQTSSEKNHVLHKLALYLTGKECQEQRFDAVAWGPSNMEVANMAKVQENPALAALLKQAAYATPQGVIPGAWWDFAKVLGTVAQEAEYDDTAALQAGLDSYTESLNAVITPTELPVWALVGTINEGSWTAATATVMTESVTTAGEWYVETAVEAGDEFKCCPIMVKGNTVDWGQEINWNGVVDNTGAFAQKAEGDTNIKCITAGTYKFVRNGTTLTISAI